MIKNSYENDGILYEIVLQLPNNVKHDVDVRTDYFVDNNSYDYV